MKKQRFKSVWDAIENSADDAANMKARSTLMIAISEHIRTRKLTQEQAARLFGVTQPRVSDLVRGKIERFTIDMLINMLTRAGIRVEIKVRTAA